MVRGCRRRSASARQARRAWDSRSADAHFGLPLRLDQVSRARRGAVKVGKRDAEVNAALNGDADAIEDLKDMLADANEAGCPLGRNK